MVQDFVVRVFFKTFRDVESTQNKLLGMELDSDFVQAGNGDPGAYKLIFATGDLATAKKAVKSMGPKPTHFDVFDPANVDAGFVKLNLD